MHHHSRVARVACCTRAIAVLFLWVLLAVSPCRCDRRRGGPPHILLIVADDLGWNDVGWRDRQMFSPVLDNLARDGVILNQTYMQSSCSPSRAALLTGLYPFRLGLQHSVIQAGKAEYLTDAVATLPQHLQQLGYSTHLVGKWHLGFCDWKYTPTYRGFDSFYGFYNAVEGYYSHIGKRDGYDFRDNEKVDWSAKGTYSTNLFAARAQEIIRNHNSSKPLFLFLSFQAVHAPFEVPQHYIDSHCSHVPKKDRRLLCGVLAAMDEAVGNVTRTLHQAGLADDTVVVFTTDNGGPVKKGSSNWPLRGSKTTLWEGGSRAVSFVHSRSPDLVPARGSTFNGLMHVVDWFPTLLAIAQDKGESTILPKNIDGINMWRDIRRASRIGSREEIVYNIDDVKNNAAIRVGRWKLIEGNPGKPHGWYNPPEGVRPATQPPNKQPSLQLFDLQLDPYETRNLAPSKVSLVRQLQRKLAVYRQDLVPAVSLKNAPVIRSSYPAYHNHTWAPGFCADRAAESRKRTTTTTTTTTTEVPTTTEYCPI